MNDWVTDLQTHSQLFLTDWQQLDLDNLLGWAARETLEFYFLDPRMDPHRRNFITFTELAAAQENPILRLWLIEALEATGEGFFTHTSALATKVETANGLRLDYLSGRHYVAHVPRQATQPASFKDRALDPAASEAVAEMINTAFDIMDEHLTISLEAAITNRFAIGPVEGEIAKEERWNASATTSK